MMKLPALTAQQSPLQVAGWTGGGRGERSAQHKLHAAERPDSRISRRLKRDAVLAGQRRGGP